MNYIQKWRFALIAFCLPLVLWAQKFEVSDDYLDEIYPSLEELYIHFHQNPELSMQEEETSTLMTQNLRDLGFEIITDLGATNRAGIFRNGEGPVVLIRADMDALPVREQTGLPYASEARGVNAEGDSTAIMHACGHDVHMTVFTGVARTLVRYKDEWSGTLVMVAQAAEEAGLGADLLFKNKLYDKVPKPDYALALHTSSYHEAGKVGYKSGPVLASVDMIDITVHGQGGHGAAPHTTIDPIVLSAQLIESFQTIVSRENNPFDPAVVTVGSIHGGKVHNVIPDEVKLQLTIRSYSTEVRNKIISALERKCNSLAKAAGLKEEQYPDIKIRDPYTPTTINDKALTERLVGVFKNVLGEENVVETPAYTFGEDFSRFGLQDHKVPICLFWLGAVDPEKMDGRDLPSLHSPFFAPLPEPTLKTGVKAMTSAALELFEE
ncbi:amidohydrolase [Membranihabitans maritimus]|uniref:amidohydrolase n=1 Tax=Membranihabitans maritimus TaxID=2904244 RepID=UPI001F00DF1F|nr:amidohydrolase [Membranihabitans maritimus]